MIWFWIYAELVSSFGRVTWPPLTLDHWKTLDSQGLPQKIVMPGI